MIAYRQDSTAALSEPSDAFAVGCGKTVARIGGKEPQFIEGFAVQPAQDWVVTGGIFFPITRGHVDKRLGAGVFERVEMFTQERKSIDRPIVFSRRNSGL